MREYQESLCSIIDRFKGSSISVAEVGVEYGRTSEILLDRYKQLTLFMVDRWSPFPSDHPYAIRGDNHALKDAKDQFGVLKTAERATRRWGNRRVIVIDESHAAVEFISEKFDLVFLDADHHQDSVKRDIEAWITMLKPSGVFCGHDYGGDHYGVTRVVDALVSEGKFSLRLHPGSVFELAQS